jgi:hypothetical protein
MVSENSQFMMEPERADLWSVLKANTAGAKGLVANGQGKFAGLIGGSSNDKAIFTHERFRFKANVLNNYAFAHRIPFVSAGEAFHGSARLVTLQLTGGGHVLRHRNRRPGRARRKV